MHSWIGNNIKDERLHSDIKIKLERNRALKSIIEWEGKREVQLHSNGESGWPSGVLQEVFSFCEWKDLLTARLVCKDWSFATTLPSTWFPFFLALGFEREAAQNLLQVFQRKSIPSFLILRVHQQCGFLNAETASKLLSKKRQLDDDEEDQDKDSDKDKEEDDEEED